MFAAWKNDDPQVLQCLIEAGGDVDVRDHAGWTPLLCAARHNRTPRVTALLIEATNDVNARHEGDWTPLMVAAKYNTPDVLRLLLGGGGDAKARNAGGRRALDYAEKNELIAGTPEHWMLSEATFRKE